MAANVADLKSKLTDRYRVLHSVAVDELNDYLDQVVPDSGDIHPDKLRFSRVETFSEDRETFKVQITYTAPQADFTEYGTSPHDIEPQGPGYPLTFYWPKIGGIAHFMVVHHPGSHKHDGWFRDALATWPDRVRDALGKLG